MVMPVTKKPRRSLLGWIIPIVFFVAAGVVTAGILGIFVGPPPRAESFGATVALSGGTVAYVVTGTPVMIITGIISIIGWGTHKRDDPVRDSLGVRILRVLFYLAIFVATVVALLYPYRASVAQTAQALQEGRWSVDFRESKYLEEAIATIEEEIGHDSVLSVHVRADRIYVEAPIVSGERATDRWLYRRAMAENAGAASTQPDDVLVEQFSLSEVEWANLWPAFEEAQNMIDIIDDEAMILVRRGWETDTTSENFGSGKGPVEITFSFRDDYNSARFQVNTDGTGLELVSEN